MVSNPTTGEDQAAVFTYQDPPSSGQNQLNGTNQSFVNGLQSFTQDQFACLEEERHSFGGGQHAGHKTHQVSDLPGKENYDTNQL